jgi:hypothetical protein
VEEIRTGLNSKDSEIKIDTSGAIAKLEGLQKTLKDQDAPSSFSRAVNKAIDSLEEDGVNAN